MEKTKAEKRQTFQRDKELHGDISQAGYTKLRRGFCTVSQELEEAGVRERRPHTWDGVPEVCPPGSRKPRSPGLGMADDSFVLTITRSCNNTNR